MATLRKAWLDHKVLVLRDQHISQEEHIAFGRMFGDLEVHPFTENDDGHPEIVVLEAGGVVSDLRIDDGGDCCCGCGATGVGWRGVGALGVGCRGVGALGVGAFGVAGWGVRGRPAPCNKPRGSPSSHASNNSDGDQSSLARDGGGRG